MSYPSAVHSYFAVRNKHNARSRFLLSEDRQPVFEYGKQFDIKAILSRKSQLLKDSPNYEKFELIYEGAKLQVEQAPDVERFRELNEKMYGAPTLTMASAIVKDVLSRITESTAEFADFVQSTLRIHSGASTLYPTDALFLQLKQYFDAYAGMHSNDGDLLTQLQHALALIGKSQQGWRVVLVNDGHVRVVHKAKRVLVGKDFSPKSPSASRQIVAHEVYGHVLRGPQNSIAESEGFAILLEQLTRDRYIPMRTYRYLAAAIAWGAFGERMNFRQTHEIIWRSMVIRSQYDIDDAKSRAFDECTRIFRGGRPDIPGAIYTKDILYYASNTRMWNVFATHPPTYKEFTDIIEGRKVVL